MRAFKSLIYCLHKKSTIFCLRQFIIYHLSLYNWMVTGTDGDGQPALSDCGGWHPQRPQGRDALNSTAWSNWKIASIPWISTKALVCHPLFIFKIIKAWASDSLRAKRILYWGYSVKRSGTPKRGWNPFLGLFAHRRRDGVAFGNCLTQNRIQILECFKMPSSKLGDGKDPIGYWL